MSPFAYATAICTLALWLSVLGTGGTGFALTGEFGAPRAETKPKDLYEDLKAELLMDDFTGPEEISQEATDLGNTGDAQEAEVPLAEEETLPEPPEIPEIADLEPLPSIPDLPAPVREKPKPKPKPKPAPRKAPTSPRPVSKTGGSTVGRAESRGTQGAGGRGGGSGMSDAKRMGGGRMPPPSYPSSARRAGHEGTVVVEFIVGDSGSVISAYAKRTCPWPELNSAAISAVRRWKFPPGKTSKYVRPITFKLN